MLVLLVPAAARALDADVWLGKDRAALFDSYVKDIRDGQLDPERGARRLGSTWDAELARTRRRFIQAVTTADVYYALLSLKNSLHDGHGDLSVPRALTPPRARYRTALRFRPERNRGALRFVVSASTSVRVSPGLILLSVDGLTPQAALDAFREWHNSSSPEHLEFEFANWLSARDSRDEPLPSPLEVRYALRDPVSGSSVTVTLPLLRHENDFDEPEPFIAYDRPLGLDYRDWKPIFCGLNYRVYADPDSGALVLRYFSFEYRFDFRDLWNRMVGLSYAPRTLPENEGAGSGLERFDLEELERFLRSADPRYKTLLVDVRENNGGGVVEGLLSLLATRPFRLTTNRWIYTPLLRRDPAFLDAVLRMAGGERAAFIRAQVGRGDKRSPIFSFTCSSPLCRAQEAVGKPVPLGRRYRMAVLSGPYCVSSCDQFVSVFADNRMGPVLGLPSQGESSPARGEARFKMANGESFGLTLGIAETFRANGQPLEGNPARPADPTYPSDGYLRRVLASLKER